MSATTGFDAVLFLSFGGPDKPDDVRPFLENVTRGRGVPPERLDEVAEHYFHFGGVSPINALNKAMIAAVETELDRAGIDLPVYFGNRNWHPMVEDTLGADPRRRAPAGPGLPDVGVGRLLGLSPVRRGHRPGAGVARHPTPRTCSSASCRSTGSTRR